MYENKGQTTARNPDTYLGWVWSQNKEEFLAGEIILDKKKALMEYIEDNLDSIEVGDDD